MPRTENTEIHRKSRQQIQAIEALARENKRIADIVEERAHLAKFVIDLVKELSCFNLRQPGQPITFSKLGPSAQLAYAALGFQPDSGNIDTDLETLRSLIIIAKEEDCPAAVGFVKAIPKSEPTSSPTATRSPGRGSGKKA